MKKTRIFLFGLVILCFSMLVATAQESNIVKKELSQAEIDRIIKAFTANEANFRDALTNYVFSRDAKIQTLGMGGQVTGQYWRKSSMIFGSDGRRFEKITYFPMPTTPGGFVTAEDLDDLSGVNPFALEPSAINLYSFTYLGKERIDELDLYVFDVTPKVMPDPKKTKQRFFLGRIWVDDQDLMIVKSKGKGVPDYKDNKFPVVETWRQQIDGKYWFPVFSSSNDELIFDNGTAIKLRIVIKYADYAQGRTKVTIGDDEEEVKDEKPAPSPTPTKP